ncbi:MAG: hypothetical protein ACI9GH_000031 [Candidatus Paceibacteria bacterium]|jgi:hypothetical protein
MPNLAFLTLDVIILIAIAVLFFALSMYAGKKVLARLILLFYPTTLIFENLPYVSLENIYARIGAWALIFVILFFLLEKNTGAKKLYSGGRKFLDGVILSIAATVIVLVLYYHVLPIGQIYSFSLPFSEFFTSKVPYGVWIAIPLLSFLLTNRSDS